MYVRELRYLDMANAVGFFVLRITITLVSNLRTQILLIPLCSGRWAGLFRGTGLRRRRKPSAGGCKTADHGGLDTCKEFLVFLPVFMYLSTLISIDTIYLDE